MLEFADGFDNPRVDDIGVLAQHFVRVKVREAHRPLPQILRILRRRLKGAGEPVGLTVDTEHDACIGGARRQVDDCCAVRLVVAAGKRFAVERDTDDFQEGGLS